MSDTGARSKTEGSLTLPDTFELIIEVDGTEGSCEVVWQSGRELGVRFLGARPARWRPNASRWSTRSSLPPHRPCGARRNHDVWRGSLQRRDPVPLTPRSVAASRSRWQLNRGPGCAFYL